MHKSIRDSLTNLHDIKKSVSGTADVQLEIANAVERNRTYVKKVEDSLAAAAGVYGDIIHKMDIDDSKKGVLMESFQKVLQHIKEEPPILELSREEYDIEDLMGEMLVLLNQEKALKFSALFASQTSKRRVITMFLAILELLKAQQITFVQRENFDELWLFARTADEEVG